VLDKFAGNLKQQPSLQAVIAGHTDNRPIGPGLAAKYPSNWELSSARSINIIHYLVNQGVAEDRFESRAFSFMQPVAGNDNAASREKNRRIEIFLTEQAEHTQ
jgi:chemotaxis protein MotB